jgi:hypothetical protein
MTFDAAMRKKWPKVLKKFVKQFWNAAEVRGGSSSDGCVIPRSRRVAFTPEKRRAVLRLTLAAWPGGAAIHRFLSSPKAGGA